MNTLFRLAKQIDRASQSFGRGLAWLSVVMVLIGAFNALARYGGRAVGINLSSNGLLEAQWYLFALIFLLGAAPTLAANRHVRVDVYYGRLSPRRQAWIDLLGCVFLLLPFCIFALVTSLPFVESSWSVWELSPDPGGLARWPIKTAIPLAFGLLIIQGLSFALGRVEVLLRPRGES